jgi:lysophospholipase L1-like esterase
MKSRLLPSLYAERCHIESTNYVNALSAQQALQNLFPDHCTCFFGDSLTRSLQVDAIDTAAVNLGIPGDTSFGVLYRCGQYAAINDGRCDIAVVTIGVNDLGRFDDTRIAGNIQKIAEQLSLRCDVVLINGILPIRISESLNRSIQMNRRIEEINRSVQFMLFEMPKVTYTNHGALLIDDNRCLAAEYTIDGLHLSPIGCRIWSAAIKADIDDVRSTRPRNPETASGDMKQVMELPLE